MPTLDATVGGAAANSYVTEDEADTYFSTRLQVGAWSDGGATDRDAALIQATRQIDALSFMGVKLDTAQALQWPRFNVFDPDGYEYEGVPVIVKHATMEAALRLLADSASGSDTNAPTGLEPFKRARIGPLEVEVDKGYRAGLVPDIVRRLLRPVLAGSLLMATLERS